MMDSSRALKCNMLRNTSFSVQGGEEGTGEVMRKLHSTMPLSLRCPSRRCKGMRHLALELVSVAADGYTTSMWMKVQ